MARRCTWCYESGHNRRTCPKKKEYIKDNPDSAHAKAWAAHDNIIKNSVKASSKKRTCGYCEEKGHNARTCSVKKSHRAELVRLCKRANEYMVKTSYKVGATPGSLWEITDYEKTTGNTVRTLAIMIKPEFIRVPKCQAEISDLDRQSPWTWGGYFKSMATNTYRVRNFGHDLYGHSQSDGLGSRCLSTTKMSYEEYVEYINKSLGVSAPAYWSGEFAIDEYLIGRAAYWVGKTLEKLENAVKRLETVDWENILK